MLAQEICLELEPYVAKAISGLAAELRLVDIADYIAYLRMERYGCIADIVRDAAELYFTPGYIEFAMDGEASAEWGTAPEVTLMLLINSARAKAHIALKLCEHHAEIKLGYVNFAWSQISRFSGTMTPPKIPSIAENPIRPAIRRPGFALHRAVRRANAGVVPVTSWRRLRRTVPIYSRNGILSQFQSFVNLTIRGFSQMQENGTCLRAFRQYQPTRAEIAGHGLFFVRRTGRDFILGKALGPMPGRFAHHVFSDERKSGFTRRRIDRAYRRKHRGFRPALLSVRAGRNGLRDLNEF
jgi:hypothetical protein